MRSIKPHVTPDEYAELRDSGRPHPLRVQVTGLGPTGQEPPPRWFVVTIRVCVTGMLAATLAAVAVGVYAAWQAVTG